MSVVQICNRGLTKYLGFQRITSLSDGSPEAEACSIHYDDTLNALLERNWWNFATGRVNLAQLENDRPAEWKFKYARPSAALAIRWVNGAETARAALSIGQSPDAPRETTAEFIYCDVASATCEFTKPMTDTTLFPQSFKDALSAMLASEVAQSLTEDATRTRSAREAAERYTIMAVSMDARNTPPIETGVPEFLSVRGIT